MNNEYWNEEWLAEEEEDEDDEWLLEFFRQAKKEDEGNIYLQDPRQVERVLKVYRGYTGAVKPPVRRTGNRKSGPEETGIYAAEPPSRRNSFPGWGRQLIGYIIRSVPDPVRIPLSWSGSWQDRSERC